MKLYGYWRSSAAYRVRIVMHLKGIDYESIPVHLVKNGGEQHSENYVELNSTHLVPTLVDGDFSLNQSIPIIDYLEQLFPEQSIFPSDIKQRALVKAFAFDIACEIHPINNLRVQQYLVNELKVDDAQKSKWIKDWISKGFESLEVKLSKSAGKYCFGDNVTLADICLVPQVYNAIRFGIDMTNFPLITQVVNNCNQLDAFVKALPENQGDAVS